MEPKKKKNKIGLFFKSVFKGVVDGIPVLSSIKNNIKEEGIVGEGKLDFIRLIASIGMVLTLLYSTYSYIKGEISEEQYNNIIENTK